MINRELIRIKVVQLLYSYLMINNRFSLYPLSDSPQQEERYAHDLYLQMLVLMVKLSDSITKYGQGKPLAETRFIKRLRDNNEVKALLEKYSREHFPFEGSVASLAGIIKESGIYKLFLKNMKEDDGIRDEQVWQELFKHIISVDPRVLNEARRMPLYTHRAYERMEEMIYATFANLYASSSNLNEALKELERSLASTRALYFYLLQLPVAITDQRELDIENGRNKYIKTEEDINPNMRLVDNEFVKALRNDEAFKSGVENRKIDWLGNNPGVIRQLLKAIMASELYRNYIEKPVTDFQTDSEFWRDAMHEIVLTNDDLLEELESKSVFWNDDVFVIGDFVLKTIRRFWEASKTDDPSKADEPIYDMYKDEEDARFGAELFGYVVRNRDYYRDLINESVDTRKWDCDRIAYMDVVIIMTALAELLNYPQIPVSATVNEFVDIARYYSTNGSPQFVHGVLGTLINRLREEKQLLK
ncbi:MAG: hypothetical protein HDR95_07385 [Bacteroides sp.]|nr:hypothetical protein [Bacteroides sp.]